MKQIDNFNIRVYFILFNDKGDSILVSDEMIYGKLVCKFPGGGLEYGEGVIDCAKREAIEELGQEIEVLSHFYTTEFFQKSAFRDNDQIISIYYKARLASHPEFKFTQSGDSFAKGSSQKFRWLKLVNASENDMTLPIDKVVIEKLSMG
ncbi:MAG: 8-oxo-dGTP diphosphatase [Litorivivens sp.]|jgi:8-oxo-dGTP diphosphatase